MPWSEPSNSPELSGSNPRWSNYAGSDRMGRRDVSNSAISVGQNLNVRFRRNDDPTLCHACNPCPSDDLQLRATTLPTLQLSCEDHSQPRRGGHLCALGGIGAVVVLLHGY